uniref:CUB domain-containing protein n=1 Tax=Strongyloides venezuelensis TaxID=75913 RepID=A0A0K0EUB7_STRVS
MINISENCCSCPTFYVTPLCKYVKISSKIYGSKIQIATKARTIFKINGIKSCYYVIKAPVNRKVKITILLGQSKLTPTCQSGSGLCIKFLKNRIISPAVFCGETNDYLIFEGRDVIIHYVGKSETEFYSIVYENI